jgi:dienelactone hydrolase
MRLLEMVLLLACAAVSIRVAATGRIAGTPWAHGLQLLLAVVLITQILVEGWRWQMAPAYAATLLVAATLSLPGLTTFVLSCATIVTGGLLGASVLGCLVLPFVAPEDPHGPFAVGVTELPVSIQRPAGIDSYELKVIPKGQLWYPAEAQPRWPALGAWVAERIAARLRAVPAPIAVTNAPVAQSGKKFPVVVYFDGWPEDRIQNVNLILELVSRGFAVTTVTWPGLVRPMADYASQADFDHSAQLNHARTRLHAQDGIAVLDILSRLDAEPGKRFTGRLDSQHASMLGFSYGGAVAAQASRLDPRIKAAVNMDGRHFADALDSGVEKPYLFICEELLMPTAAELASPDPMTRFEAGFDTLDYSRGAANLRARGGVRVTVVGAAHANFTDRALRSPLRRFSGTGKINAYRAQQIINTFVVEFLSRYGVPGQPPPFNAPWPQFAEARLESWPSPGARP